MKKDEKEHKEEAQADEEPTADAEEEVAVPLNTHINNISHSIFFNVEVYLNNEQFYTSNGLYPHKS